MRGRLLRSRPNGHFEEPLINLTPLIDVVFVILIMFIVIAPVLDLDRIELADAGPGTSSEGLPSVQENSPISIHVHRDNSITLNHQPILIEQLPALLKEAKEKYPLVRPQLFQDSKGHFGVYQSVKNAAESAGFTELDIILKPSSKL
jgi:biopolymer transport protein ExbD